MTDFNSDLKNLIHESKASLFEIEEVLHKAEGLLEQENNARKSEQEEISECVIALTLITQKLQQRLAAQGSGAAKEEVLNLHQRMAGTCDHLLHSFQRLEISHSRNTQEIARLMEEYGLKLEEGGSDDAPDSGKSPLGRLLAYARQEFELEHYDQCAKVLHSVLRIVPNEPEALALLSESEKRWEDAQMKDELEIHVENVKKEAMHFFDEGNYQECIGRFQFLCEIDPGNNTYRDFLNLSREELKQLEEQAPAAAPSPAPETDMETETAVEPLSESPAPLQPEETLPAPLPFAQEQPSAETEATPEQPEAAASPADNIDEAWAELFKLKALISDPNFGATPAESGSREPENAAGEQEQLAPVIPCAPAVAHQREQPAISITPEPDQARPRPRKIKVFAAIAGIAALVLIGVAASRAFWPRHKAEVIAWGQLSVASEPTGAMVFVDGAKAGETSLDLSHLIAGNHQLRLEKDNFVPYAQEYKVEAGSTSQLFIPMEKIKSAASSLPELENAARELFQQKRYFEAGQKCAALLAQDPKNPTGLELRGKIERYFTQQGNRSLAARKWEEARVAFENALRLNPASVEARTQLKMLKEKTKAAETAMAAQNALQGKIADWEGQIGRALQAGNLLPPQPENALELVHQLQAISPADSVAANASTQILQAALTQAHNKIASRDLEGAKALLAQLQSYYSEAPEIASVKVFLRSEELKNQNQIAAWMEKAEASMAAERYVTPATDNVILYCNRALGVDSQRAKASALKQEAFAKTVAKAKALIQNEKYEEARDLYAALLAFSPHEAAVPLSPAAIKTELARLEFSTWPVIYSRTMGSCTGRLRFNAYVISFIPSGDSKDGFTQKLSEVVRTESGDHLKIQFKNKTYRFQINAAANRTENREKLTALNQQMGTLIALAKPSQ